MEAQLLEPDLTTAILRKKCSRCKERKPITSFHPAKQQTFGVSCYCKPCWRELRREYGTQPHVKAYKRNQNLLRNYGITSSDFETLLLGQNNTCAICSATTPGGKTGQWHVDHSHATLKVRGLLCDACNRALGFFRDNVETLRSAITYLEK